MKIAIVGSRDFSDYQLLKQTVSDYIYKMGSKEDCFAKNCIECDCNKIPFYCEDGITIISGGARGADSLAEKFADDFGMQMLIFLANWNLYGKSAGMIRNNDIIKNADVVFAFWDGQSRGTANSIKLAKEQNKKLYIIEV